MIPLTKLQREIMEEFFSIPKTCVLFNKRERKTLWNAALRRNEMEWDSLKRQCPALVHRVQKSYQSGDNIQSAVFSECVYAQTFANMFSLKKFVNCEENPSFVPVQIHELLTSYQLLPRYVYSLPDKSRMLIQAGGCNGIDSALITVFDLNIYTIEFKEPGAKTSEPDLPKYGEDGCLKITDEFLMHYPQFEAMLREQEGLNFFDVMGNNVRVFSSESVNIAVSNNYTKKYADVICTEDRTGFLVMMPSNQVSRWAEIEGEIRPAGRNSYGVWTPNALQKFLIQNKAVIKSDVVTIEKEKLKVRKERGGGGRISGYKINPLFFVRIENCTEQQGKISFYIQNVRQLNPTIAGKMFFKTLQYDKVKEYYYPQ